MSEAGALARLARLHAEVEVDLRALDARAADTTRILREWDASGAIERERLIVLAVNLHGHYTALETAMERVARLLDENVPSGPTWHVDLVAQMETEVPSVRPAMIPKSIVSDLHELRKFRHFFRNAYLLDLDPKRVREHADRLVRVHPTLVRSSRDLQNHIQATIDALVKS